MNDGKVFYHTALWGDRFLKFPYDSTRFYGRVKDYKGYVIKEEKQQFFDALKKEGKHWNAETKQIEDVKPKWTPKPFDKVLVKDGGVEDVWSADFFSHFSEDGDILCVGGAYSYCIPYNEETAHLIGTTDDWEG